MYKKLEIDEGIKVLLRLVQTYDCMEQYRPLYTEERLKRLAESNNGILNMVVFHRELGNMESVTGFMDDYRDLNKIIIWANHTLGITNEIHLRNALRGHYQLICDYSKEKGRKIFYARKVYWKFHKPVWLSIIPNWKEVMEDVAKDYFVDFEIDDNKIIEYVVK